MLSFVTNCNAKASSRMGRLHSAPITFVSREIHSATFRQSANNRFTESGNDADSVLKGKVT
jgi:hypothetical protein